MPSTRRTPQRRSSALACLSTLAVALAVACSGKTLPYAGGLMVSIQTDLAAPKDVAAVGLFITSDGRPIFSDTRDVAPNGEVRFPATIAVVGDEKRPRAQVKIRVVAFKGNGDVRILRDILTTIPKGRTGLLRAPLLWINEGSGKGSRNQIVSGLATRDATGAADGFARLTSACPDGQTFLEGACGDATVDGDSLPDYQERDVFGGGNASGEGGRCFDVRACFGPAASVQVDRASCSAPLDGVDSNDPNLSFAVQLPTSAATGECRAGDCLVPLDKGTGWKLGGPGVSFPKAICARLESGAALGIVRTTACPSKDATTPSCGPASLVSTSSAPPGLDGGVGSFDGGAVATTDFESPRFLGGEPNLSSVAIDQDSVYVGRIQANPPPPGVLKLSRADVVAQKVPPQFSLLASFSSAQRSVVRVGPQPRAAYVAVASEDGQVRLCTPTSAGVCPSFSFTGGGGVPVIALGDAELYVFGSTGEAPRLFAIPLQSQVLQARVGPVSAPVTAMHYAKGRLFFGLEDGSIQQCTVPCQVAGALSEILSAPPAGGAISAMTSDDRVPGKLFVLRIPLDGVTVSQGGVFVVSMAGQGEQQLAPGGDILLQGSPPPLEPPSALAVDSEYVYWSGVFPDPSSGVRKYGVVAKKHTGLAAPAGLVEVNGGENVPVESISVDGSHVFWTYDRPTNALAFAAKKRPF
jgi:hypothetical protein